MKLFTRLQNFIYILQLEEYENKRLLRWLPKFFFRFDDIQVRENLVWTSRVKLMFLLTIILQILSAFIIYLTCVKFQSSIVISILILIISCFLIWLLTPFFVYLVNLKLQVLINFKKKSIYQLAESKILSNKQNEMKVVVIAGSFGKSTVKNYLYELIKIHYQTQMIPGNINTPGGIADWICTNLKANTKILIAEADTYRYGEIMQSCTILHPDISVLTNIGDQHLERFGSIDNLATALLEVFQYSEKDSKCFYFQKDSEFIKKLDLFKDNLRQYIPVSDNQNINIEFAKMVAEQLGVPEKFLMSADTELCSKLLDRKGDMKEYLGFRCFDYSYNISLTTARKALVTAHNYAVMNGKKIIAITGGIPEIIDSSPLVEFGNLLEQYADVVILARSDYEKTISNRVSKSKVRYISKYTELSQMLSTFDKNEYILLLFPELNDLYY